MSRFDRLYRENFRFVWAAAQRCGAPPSCVDDVVQDVFVTAHRRIDELRWEVSARGWLYGVTRRVAFRYRRTEARVARRKSAVASRGPRSAQPHHRHDAATALERLLDQLEPMLREVFVMTELLGMSAPEIAAEVEAPLNTIYSRLRLARGRLRKLAGSEAALAGELRSTRTSLAPAPGQAERTHAGLLPLLGTAGATVSPAVAGAFKFAAGPVAALAIAAIAVAASRSPPTEVGSSSTPAAALAEKNEVPLPPSGLGSAKPPAVPDDPVCAVPPTDTEESAPASAPTGEKPAARSPRSTASQDRPPDAGTALRQEIALIDAAKALGQRGSYDEALRKLKEHARRFPTGQLRDAQQAMRFEVLCGAGRTREADAAAATLHREHPTSSVARKIPKKCLPP